MDRPPWFTWRLVYPSTLLFLVLAIIYAIGVESGLLNAFELRLRALPLPRHYITLLSYMFTLLVMSVAYHFLGDLDGDSWVQRASESQGGARLIDILIIIVSIGLAVAGWRLFDFLNAELLVLISIAVFTAFVGFLLPPRVRTYPVRREGRGDISPNIPDLLDRFGVDQTRPQQWVPAVRELHRVNSSPVREPIFQEYTAQKALSYIRDGAQLDPMINELLDEFGIISDDRESWIERASQLINGFDLDGLLVPGDVWVIPEAILMTPQPRAEVLEPQIEPPPDAVFDHMEVIVGNQTENVDDFASEEQGEDVQTEEILAGNEQIEDEYRIVSEDQEMHEQSEELLQDDILIEDEDTESIVEDDDLP